MTKRSRRQFLKLSSALAASGVMRPQGVQAPDPPQLTAPPLDCIVVGAGLSGLMAARTLVAQGVTRVLVLEAGDRVGGRTLNQRVAGGGVAEDGGQWIGPTQTAIAQLMHELGIGSFDTYVQGAAVDDTAGSTGVAALLDYGIAESAIDGLAAGVPLDAPWDAPGAGTLDSLTVQEWMDAHMFTQGGKALFGLNVETALSAPPSAVSLLYFLFYVHSATDLDHLAEKAQEQRILGGAQAVSLAMAAQLAGAIQLKRPVRTIRHGSDWVEVTTDAGVHLARRAIVAVMPRDVGRIEFEPALPADRVALQENWTAAPGSKFHAVYPTPFWRSQGLSGQAISDSQFLAVTYDNSPPDGTPGILVGFAAADRRAPAPRRRRRRLALGSFAHFFGQEALAVLDFAEQLWAEEPFVSGCVSPLAPGVLTSWGPALRTPVGPIHWAGTETSEVWTGYMDGAVRAGERAALEVVESLGPTGAGSG